MEIDRKKYYLDVMGVDQWQLRTRDRQQDSPERKRNLEELRQRVAACTACPLHKTRTQTVFGVGNPQADLLIVGEAPGEQEDLQGFPFVGRAGKLLDAMLAAIKLNRENVYIANILKCRPPNNRDPLPEEVATCTPFLEEQVALMQPKLILAVGRYAAHYLLNTKTSLNKLRSQKFQFRNTSIPLLVTYHPAYLLRSPIEKRKAMHDLFFVDCLLKQMGGG